MWTVQIAVPDLNPTEPPAVPIAAPIVDVVVPVYNEEHVLPASVERLHTYLSEQFPFTWRITIVDNASTDATWSVATRLAAEHPGVRAIHLDRKGRGRALRHAWGASDAAVVAYMDVDLSTGLDGLLPLVAPLVSGHSDLAIGSRLAPGSAVARGPKRETVSRIYNLLLRLAFATQVRDAQCGFKAVRHDVLAPLLGAIVDEEWFFDTELLLLAEHNGLRIHQVPVTWVDDPDSRVDVRSTAVGDLRGMLRMLRTFLAGGGRLDLGPHARRGLSDDMGRRRVSFAAIGTISTVVSLALFLVTRDAFGAVGANAFALSATFLANTWANARFTWGRHRPQWSLALATYLVGLALSTSALVLVHAVGGRLAAEVGALAATWAFTTLVRLGTLARVTEGAR